MIYEVIGKCGSRITLEEQYQDRASALSMVDTLKNDSETDYIKVTETDEETLEVRSITEYWLESSKWKNFQTLWGGKFEFKPLKKSAWKSEYSTVEDSDL